MGSVRDGLVTKVGAAKLLREAQEHRGFTVTWSEELGWCVLNAETGVWQERLTARQVYQMLLDAEVLAAA